MPTGTVSKRRTKREMQERLHSLPVARRACGHTGPSAHDYYNSPGHQARGSDLCVSCYRAAERERRRRASQATVLATAGHEYEIDERDHDPEYQAALGVLRDRRAQREGKQGYVYLITESNEGGGLRYGKIGYSVNPKKRVAELQTGNPRPLQLLYTMPGTEEDERRLHRKYIKENCLQEWFWLTPAIILEFPPDTAVKPDVVS